MPLLLPRLMPRQYFSPSKDFYEHEHFITTQGNGHAITYS